MLELSETLGELYQDKFSTIATDYENQLSLLEHLTNTYENGISDLEERGYLVSTKYYEALKETEEQNISVLNKELKQLTTAMSNAVNSGAIAENSEAWYEMQTSINDVKEAIQEATTALVEYENEIRQLEWDYFDYLQEQIEYIIDESEFLIDLMSYGDLYDDRGQLTDTGMATMGLYAEEYNTLMNQADQYAEQIKELQKDLEADPYNTDLIERYYELIDAQQECILSAEDMKQSIVDMVEEGIELELDSLQNLIDEYEDALDAQKDLYDYQKNIEEQTKEIASLQKQLSAYSGDNSEETKATVQQLKVQLEEAQSDLEETEYDQYISDQKELLDELYLEYETILNERLDNVDALILDMILAVNENSATISETLTSEAESVGYTITDALQSIWSSEGTATSVVTTYGDSFLSQLTTVNDVLSKIAVKIGAMTTASDKTASSTVSSTTSSTKTTSSSSSSSSSSSTTTTSSSKSTYNDTVKKGVAAAIWVYGTKSGWGNGSTRKSRLTSKFGSSNATAIQNYINAHGSNGDLYKYWVSSGKDLSKYYYSAFKKGGLADYTGMAWLDGTPTEPEMVLNSEDTANFIALKDALQAVASGNSPLLDLLSGENGGTDILSKLSEITAPAVDTTGTSIGDITYQITIPIDKVSDYNDFMNKISTDTKFQKWLESTTIDRLMGGSRTAKNKYTW